MQSIIVCMLTFSLVLHPRYKKQYFENMKWPAEWVNEAVRLLREQWDLYYAPTPVSTDDGGAASQAAPVSGGIKC